MMISFLKRNSDDIHTISPDLEMTQTMGSFGFPNRRSFVFEYLNLSQNICETSSRIWRRERILARNNSVNFVENFKVTKMSISRPHINDSFFTSAVTFVTATLVLATLVLAQFKSCKLVLAAFVITNCLFNFFLSRVFLAAVVQTFVLTTFVVVALHYF